MTMGSFVDIAGCRFGSLVVVRHLSGSRQSRPKWECRCDCGNSSIVDGYNLRRSFTKSCGCERSGNPAPNFVDLSGKRFNRLTVVSQDGHTSTGQALWKCICECGRETRTTSTKLKTGHTSSCGCFHAEQFAERTRIHGLFADGRRHPLINCYTGMIQRCYNENDRAYDRYGGRGIRVCDRWRYGEEGKTGFQCFVEDMGERPNGLSIDREGNDGNYEPANCRWATAKQQANNRRPARRVA